MNTQNPPSTIPASRWQRLGQRLISAFHAYATWLVSISWKRFTLLALLVLITAGILKELPPFSFKVHSTVEVHEPQRSERKPRAGADHAPSVHIDKGVEGGPSNGVDISIDQHGIRVTKRPAGAASAPAASETASAPTAGSLSTSDREEIAQTLQLLREEIRAALQEAVREIRDSKDSDADGDLHAGQSQVHVEELRFGDFLPNLAMLWIVASIIIKITYKGELQARADAARATQTAESEQIKRQAAEARVAAVQAQVEPHFLFNTLASIDHLIETDPPRASKMQKSLIALLRATLPSLREDTATHAQRPVRSLGQEADVIVPYLDIMKVRMEDRLQAQVDIPAGLRSAEFPPLMLQGLVENAIKHGLEPKAEGGELTVRAQVVDGALELSVRDTGVGLTTEGSAQPASTAGSGTGLANIRERLRLLYGERAALKLSPLPEGGTLAIITMPYTVQPAQGSSASS